MATYLPNWPIYVALEACSDNGVEREGYYSVSLLCQGRPLICRSYNPISDAARKLLARGFSADNELVVKNALHEELLRTTLANAANGGFDLPNVRALYRERAVQDRDLDQPIRAARLEFEKQDPGAMNGNNVKRGDERAGEETASDKPLFELLWHGRKYDRDLRSWLVKDLIFETGTGLASGQWGTAKTFTVLDLAASIMTATQFAGREVVRQGGVLFIAAEGANEIPIRLEGVVEQKLRPLARLKGTAEEGSLSKLPFAWIEDCPDLQDKRDFNRLIETAKQAAHDIRNQFDLPLALIVIDTLSAAGNFSDANDAAEGQQVMNRLAFLSKQTGAFVLAVDHFGKAVETGTRGTTAKEAAADVVLALLADR